MTESDLNAVTLPNYGRFAELITLRVRLPEKQLLHPKKHRLKPDKQPTEKKWPRDLYGKENAIFLDNCTHHQTTITPACKALLNTKLNNHPDEVNLRVVISYDLANKATYIVV